MGQIITAIGATVQSRVSNASAAWQEARLEVLPVLLKGDKLPDGHYSIQQFNTRHYAADQDRPLTVSQRRLNRSRHKLLAFLASVLETQLLDLKSGVGVWVKYATYGHCDERLRDLQNYRRKVALGDKSKLKSQRRI